jgi:8-oxo-dGTP pyrophosphatase MutT (NUDIX family)
VGTRAWRGERVRAAGGVVCRGGAGGATQVLVIHRPRYDDWTLPKGTLEEGEDEAACALREVEEETGFRCALAAELGTVSYTDPYGRPKTVRYWEMHPVSGAARPGEGVDEVRWTTAAEAVGLLSHERDRELVRTLAQRRSR